MQQVLNSQWCSNVCTPGACKSASGMVGRQSAEGASLSHMDPPPPNNFPPSGNTNKSHRYLAIDEPLRVETRPFESTSQTCARQKMSTTVSLTGKQEKPHSLLCFYFRMAEPRFNNPYFWPPPPAMPGQVSDWISLSHINHTLVHVPHVWPVLGGILIKHSWPFVKPRPFVAVLMPVKAF